MSDTRTGARITRHHARKGQAITVTLNDGTVITGRLDSWTRIAIRVQRDDLSIADYSASQVWHAAA